MGRENLFEWNDPQKVQRHLNATLQTLDLLAREFLPSRKVSAKMAISVALIGVVNEPRIDIFQGKVRERVGRFLADAYKTITSVRGDYFVVYGDGFLGNHIYPFLTEVFGSNFAEKDKLILGSECVKKDLGLFSLFPIDSHKYLIFDDYLLSMSDEAKLEFVERQYTADFEYAAENYNFTRIISGEFSIADTDCGKFVNSIRDNERGMRYRRLKGGACSAIEDPAQWGSEYRKFLNDLAVRQTAAFERGLGWFYWTWKTHGGVNAHWDYSVGAREGVIPAGI